VIGGLGCLLAILLGAAAATDYGVLVAGAIVALAFFSTAVVVYVRDPVLAFVWLWIFEVFNPSISAVFGYFSPAGETIRQADELLVVLFVILTVWRAIQARSKMPGARFVLPGAAVAVCGLLGAALHHVPLTVAAVGAWLGLKLWVMVIVTLLLPWKRGDAQRVYKILMRVGVFVAIFGVLDYLTHAAVSRALHTSIYNFETEAFRGEAVHSIFPHPGEYSLFMSLLFALAFASFAVRHRKMDLALAVLFAGSVILSLRLKGFLSLAAVVMIVAFVQGMADHRRGVAILLVGGLLFVGALSVEGNVITAQVTTYTSKVSPRALLYKTGEKIANDDSPLGVGFGRFGSYPSRIYYSPVYDQYELSGIYGLSRSYPDFIDDTSWPSVMGEAGYLGLIAYAIGVILLLLAIVRRLRRSSSEERWSLLAALCMLVVVLVTSIAQGVLFDWIAITSVVILLGAAFEGRLESSAASGPGSERAGRGSISSISKPVLGARTALVAPALLDGLTTVERH
jgi:hypothetical protein